jgi:hypothetical protein
MFASFSHSAPPPYLSHALFFFTAFFLFSFTSKFLILLYRDVGF